MLVLTFQLWDLWMWQNATCLRVFQYLKAQKKELPPKQVCGNDQYGGIMIRKRPVRGSRIFRIQISGILLKSPCKGFSWHRPLDSVQAPLAVPYHSQGVHPCVITKKATKSRWWIHSDEASDPARFTTGCSSRVTLHGVAWAMANTGVWLRLLKKMQGFDATPGFDVMGL